MVFPHIHIILNRFLRDKNAANQRYFALVNHTWERDVFLCIEKSVPLKAQSINDT
jgi:hypothetical protein